MFAALTTFCSTLRFKRTARSKTTLRALSKTLSETRGEHPQRPFFLTRLSTTTTIKNLRTTFETTPSLRECSGIYGPPSTGRGSLEQTSLPALIGQAPMGSPFLGGISAPAGKPPHSSTRVHTCRATVSMLQRSS